jgi:hypothetical protein
MRVFLRGSGIRRMLLIGLFILMLGGGFFVGANGQVSADSNQTCFPQTSQCLSGVFLTYWQTNGELRVFGYPLTSAINEPYRDTGQEYQTQWLERNRFEVHPEYAGSPYEILLGLLGKQRLSQLNRVPDTREPGAKPGCLWFEETGHNVCNQQGALGFLSYWEGHGLQIQGLDNYARSLQLFGLPLTTPKLETNANGDTVLTQWFERARFEWHPTNPDAFKVLLGLLGKEILGQTAAPEPTNPPAEPTRSTQPPVPTSRPHSTATPAPSSVMPSSVPPTAPPTARPTAVSTTVPATATVKPSATIVLPTDLPTAIPTNTIALPVSP